MRFAWQQKKSGNKIIQAGCLTQLFRLAYNAAWLLPIIMTFRGDLAYMTGFVIFAAVCIIRLLANLYANNSLTAQQYDLFLLRA